MENSKNDLWLYFALTFAWSWLINIPRVLAALGVFALSPLFSTILGYVAVFGPGVAAFSLTRIRSGRQGLSTLWKAGWKADFKRVWWIPAVILMPVMGGLTILIMNLAGQPIPWEYGLPPAMIVPIGLLIWLLGALPEEYGWRGYALPRLLEKSNALIASLILGAIWALWHLPLHFIPTTTQHAIPIWEYALQTIVLSILYTWIYQGSHGSILLAGIFHAAGNLTGAVLPYWATRTGRWISFSLLLVFALVIIATNRSFLTKGPANG